MKKYSKNFWITFWSLSAVFLFGWFLFWNTKNQGISSSTSFLINILPINQQTKHEYNAFITIGEYFLKKDGEEKNVLILFQNNLEIRPGGGFIGAFGIVKIKNGKVVKLETHDLSNFDMRIPNTIEPPYPMKEIGYVDSWNLRDSNFSPDFENNATKAKEFYKIGKGKENFDAVIGITSNVLTSILEITGPIQVEGYPGTYDSGNAILSLEYQVEQAFEQQGIDKKDRKLIMSDLANEIENRVFAFTLKQKIEFAKTLKEDLVKKDIQLFFVDEKLQQHALDANWAGKVDEKWSKDYLLISDANLGAFKSDYHVKRSFEYTVDLTKELPEADLKITYDHTAKQKDWMTRNYQTYLRVYVPEGSQLLNMENFDDARIEKEFGKQYFGSVIRVPINSSKTVSLKYSLPEFVEDDYSLKIQKQPGINDMRVKVVVIDKNGKRWENDRVLNSDLELNLNSSF